MDEKSTSERSANVLIKDDIAKIADFGLSRIIASGDYEQKKLSKYDSKFPVRFTAPETVINPAYQSTEGDVWSFGILIYEILSYGKRPFSEVPMDEVGQAHESTWVNPGSSVNEYRNIKITYLDKTLYETKNPQFEP